MADAKGLKIDTMRSYLGRARGLGAAKGGFHHGPKLVPRESPAA